MLKKDLELSHVSNELGCATDMQLATTHQLESNNHALHELLGELDKLKGEKKSSNKKVQTLTKDLKIKGSNDGYKEAQLEASKTMPKEGDSTSSSEDDRSSSSKEDST